MYFITKELYFPPVEEASYEGILAVGGDLSVERLLMAYNNGIFPWFDADEPILWWSPPERMVVNPNDYKVSKSLRNILNRNIFEVTINKDFESVIENCQQIARKGQDGTWISDDIIKSYTELHQLGKAKSFEVWQNNELVGGLYGLDLGNVFCGESMFAKVSNASKAGFIWFIEQYKSKFKLIDCQVYTPHLESLGAREIPKLEFLKYLESNK